jgi:4-hydroxy 2-oxovalerate aldolase
MNKYNLLDCTLRDGGYYTNWDFEDDIVKKYIEITNILPINYIEIGYRNKAQTNYLGKFGYCPTFALQQIREQSCKKIAVMLNEKDIRANDVNGLLSPVTGLIDMVRIAVAPENIERSILLAELIKQLGFEVGFNVMYMSKWTDNDTFFSKLHKVNEVADVFNMVDSYGSVFPKQIIEILQIVKSEVTCSIGFHGHNNLEMGLINTLTAIDNGATSTDVTIMGMGRGAGNLKTELLLTCLNKDYDLEVDFNALGEIVSTFTELHKQYKWGTNLPYMISGASSMPQKDIMDMASNRLFSFNNIVRAVSNKKEKLIDNEKFSVADFPACENVLIVGGGNSAIAHIEGVKAFIQKNKPLAIVFATTRHYSLYKQFDNRHYVCLVGPEGKRLVNQLNGDPFGGISILPPYPRRMGTDVPQKLRNNTFELSSIDFADKYYFDSCTTIALQIAKQLQAKNIYLIGYDGYAGNILSEKEHYLTVENQTLFRDFQNYYKITLTSLTPTLYNELKITSLYQNL